MPEKALGRGVVPAVADVAHAQGDVVVLQELLVLVGRELSTAVRVQDDRLAVRSLPAGHEDRSQDQLAILRGRHRPADYLAPVQVDHDAEVEPSPGRVDVGDVGYPLGVRLGGGEVPLEVVADVRRPGAAALTAPLSTLGDAVQSVPGHEPGDAVAAGGLALVGQDLVHPGHAHHAIACRVVFTDASEQRRLSLSLVLMGLLTQP